LEKAEQAAAEMESAMTKREDEVAKQVRLRFGFHSDIQRMKLQLLQRCQQ
jgi:hypothetical protein